MAQHIPGRVPECGAQGRNVICIVLDASGRGVGWGLRVAPAALLRATAAKMRDEQAARPDWDRIGRLLEQSYRELHAALAVENV